ncbi:MAG: sigma-70 family RNA polymerase sigma factor [Bacteroidetes bacterium]|nr:sigma-70 family RNA polymerase sigma factor [Bacteroidota bacterium]
MVGKKEVKINPSKWIFLYGDYLFNFAQVRLNNEKSAEDLVQDTFVSALNSMDNFKGNSTERTWLTSILKNKIIDFYRKKSNQNEVHIGIKDSDESNSDFFETEGGRKGMWTTDARPNFWNTDFSTPVESKEFYQILKSCMSKLPDQWSSVFALKNMEDLSSKEICKELNISTSNYWVIIHRAKLQLRKCMEMNWANC